MASQQRQELPKRWSACFGAFSCFRNQKGGKRIVPATRIPEGNASAPQPNGTQVTGLANPATALVPSLMAPPSSPASFTNSALPSTAQSPNVFLSANSPGGPSSTMYATGPYAHETQLVSPPVFSTFTTEPSTAPLTPPPELAHLTTPSSPEVPYAQFFSSSRGFKDTNRSSYIGTNDHQPTYSPHAGSPASSLISPISRTSGDVLSSSFPERKFPPQWDPSASPKSDIYPGSDSGRLYGHETTDASRRSHDANFFCPATFAEFYLDHNPPFPHNGGRLSVSKDSDVNNTNGNQNRQTTRSPKQDPDEIEAYRASFGFSADEIITTAQYVEIADVSDESFTIAPLASNNPSTEGSLGPELVFKGQSAVEPDQREAVDNGKDILNGPHTFHVETKGESQEPRGWKQQSNVSGSSTLSMHVPTDDEDDLLSRISSSKSGRKYHAGASVSDAEIDYRRVRSLREGRGKGGFA